MIFGIGTDIAKVSRFEKWVNTPEMIARFFNQKEFRAFTSKKAACEHYAARFAAKEAFGKALGTGIFGFELADVYIVNTESGKPEFMVEGKAAEILKNKCGNSKIHVSLSHEKEFAVAFVIIEQI
ncbi:MAG: holo-ACP synthase [Treponema sp.]|nr:holo-ACP synthase [Treponema sp.]